EHRSVGEGVDRTAAIRTGSEGAGSGWGVNFGALNCLIADLRIPPYHCPMPAPQQRIDELLRFEPIVFLFLLLAHVSVLFRFEWYPSLDGPAHLYNAHLIKQLLLGNAHLAEHFTFTPFPV